MVAGAIYQLNLPEYFFGKDLKDHKKTLRYIPSVVSIFASFAGLGIVSGIENFDPGLIFISLFLWLIPVMILMQWFEKITTLVGRAKATRYGNSVVLFSFLSIILVFGGQYIAGPISFFIAIRKSITYGRNKFKRNKLRRYLIRFKKELLESERNVLLDWTDINKSKSENILYGILNTSLLMIIFNIRYINSDVLLIHFQQMKVSFDQIFILLITFSLTLSYFGIRKKWNGWIKVAIPFSVLLILSIFLLLNPRLQPLFSIFSESADYSVSVLSIVGINAGNISNFYSFAGAFASIAITTIYIRTLLLSLIEKKPQIFKSYKSVKDYEWNNNLRWLLLLGSAFLVIGYISNSLWSELVMFPILGFSIYDFFLIGLFLIAFLGIIFSMVEHNIVWKDLLFYSNSHRKVKINLKELIKDAYRKRELKLLFDWKNILVMVIIFIVLIGVSFGMIRYINPPNDVPALESYIPEYPVNLMKSPIIYSYGYYGFIEANDKISVELDVFSNDTLGYYIVSEHGYISNTTLVTGPNTSSYIEYTNLAKGKYSLLYWIENDFNDDHKALVHFNVTKSTYKPFFVGPEFFPILIISLFFIPIRPSYWLM